MFTFVATTKRPFDGNMQQHDAAANKRRENESSGVEEDLGRHALDHHRGEVAAGLGWRT